MAFVLCNLTGLGEKISFPYTFSMIQDVFPPLAQCSSKDRFQIHHEPDKAVSEDELMNFGQ